MHYAWPMKMYVLDEISWIPDGDTHRDVALVRHHALLGSDEQSVLLPQDPGHTHRRNVLRHETPTGAVVLVKDPHKITLD